MKSLHYDQCFSFSHATRGSVVVVSSRRNKTNPHHRNKFIPVLHTTHVQAFKPKLSTYDQSWQTDQQDVSFSMCRVCICWNIFNRIHFFASCDDVLSSRFMQCVRVSCDLAVEMTSVRKLSKQLRQIFSFLIIHNSFFTLLVNCSNTVVLAEQSLHHNIILEKQDHCWVNRIYTKFLISESRTTSLLHIGREMRQGFCCFFFSYSPTWVFFLSCHIQYEVCARSRYWFFFSYSPLCFFFPFLSYPIWGLRV